jgi:hypothetical protein
MRINFSYSPAADAIQEGITRLRLTLRELLHECEAVPAH